MFRISAQTFTGMNGGKATVSFCDAWILFSEKLSVFWAAPFLNFLGIEWQLFGRIFCYLHLLGFPHCWLLQHPFWDVEGRMKAVECNTMFFSGYMSPSWPALEKEKSSKHSIYLEVKTLLFLFSKFSQFDAILLFTLGSRKCAINWWRMYTVEHFKSLTNSTHIIFFWY